MPLTIDSPSSLARAADIAIILSILESMLGAGEVNMKRLLFALMVAPGLVGRIGVATAADVAPYYRAPPVLS